ncbi:Glutathione S-transferase, C-terminal domain family protein [Leishmania donovani]|uniref:Glutathione S-transferase, C-terminal domain family protein n=1 Tax=Leishmania donovani TaxID=5661 RepID=A0A504YCX8_LEIDO|nr:Glutathione S-transferase, C-terminal domain family protein [Leishmania donovani]
MHLLYKKNANNAPAQKILAAAAYAGVEITAEPCDENKASTDADFLNFCDPCGDQVDMWIDFSSTEIDAANMPYIRMAYEKATSDAPADALDKVKAVLSALEEVLSVRTFLVGERLSIADVAVAFSIHLVYRCNRKHGQTLSKEYRAVYRHYNTVMRHPKIHAMMRKEGAALGPLRS